MNTIHLTGRPTKGKWEATRPRWLIKFAQIGYTYESVMIEEMGWFTFSLGELI